MSGSSTFTSSDGDGYELQMGRWSRILAPRFVAFTGVNNGQVLDVGCGTGNLAKCLALNPDIGSVVGLDYSSAYIDHASVPSLTFATGSP